MNFIEWKDCIQEIKNIDGTINKVPTLNCIPSLFQNIISTLLLFVGIVALFLIIYSGIKFTTSGGDAKQAEGAQKTLTYAILGLVVVLFSFFIINVIADTLQTPCIKLFGFTNC